MVAKKTAWQKAADFGCDMSLLEAHLKMTPTERIISHQKALQLADELASAGKKYYAKLRKVRSSSNR